MQYQLDRAEINVYDQGARRNGQIVFKSILDNTEISIQLKVGQISDLIRQLKLKPYATDTLPPHKRIEKYK